MRVLPSIILFADIRDSSEIAGTLSIEEYDFLLNEFQVLMRAAIEQVLSSHFRPGIPWPGEISIRGDEAYLVLFAGPDGVSADAGLRAVMEIAFAMKRKWLLSQVNRQRILQGKMIQDIGIGMHMGEIALGPHPGRGTGHTAEGWAINLAKKLETASREGQYSKIIVSSSVYHRVRH